MNEFLRGACFTAAVVVATFGAPASFAQVIELRAAIDSTQEIPATGSPATGTGLMLYDLANNTFDLFVTLNGYTNLMTDSHVQDAPAGENGPALIHFGGESAFTRASGNVTARFTGRAYPGDPMKLLRNGAYLNFHSGQFPRGEIRGQLIAQPKRLVSRFTVAQEQAAFPNLAITSNAAGAAVMLYNPGTNQLSLRLSLFGFGNTLTNSHFHEGAAGVSGPVAVGLGAGTVEGYVSHGNGWWSGAFDIPYAGGDPIKLLRGGAYLNFHSNVLPNGEVRGQVVASDEIPATRMANVSSRGFVGPGAQALIAGFSINGPEPVRVLVSAKGPTLASFGIATPLNDPVLALYDSAGQLIAVNDNVGPLIPGSELARIPGMPANASESALLVVLPPGTYSAVVSGAGGATGVALLEATDLRGLGNVIVN